MGDTVIKVKVTAADGTTTQTYAVTVNRPEATNNAPVFSETTPTRTVPENSGADTDVGAVVTASDADGNTLTYTLEGTDAASFAIDSDSGQIKTVTGVDYNHEETSSYAVTVKASDGTASATIDVAITVTDVDEQPDTPAKPTLAAVSATSLTATWVKPGRNGGPDITGYNVNYRVSTATAWETFTHSGAGVTRTITGLTASTSYQVRVQALNGETDSDWSEPSDAVSTNTETTTTPDCTLNPGDLWCGVVTVARNSASEIQAGYGFVDAATDTGALSETGFSVPNDGGTNSYTIDAVWVSNTRNWRRCRHIDFRLDQPARRCRSGETGAACRQRLVRVQRCGGNRKNF